MGRGSYDPRRIKTRGAGIPDSNKVASLAKMMPSNDYCDAEAIAEAEHAFRAHQD